jgi:hypothetical protein
MWVIGSNMAGYLPDVEPTGFDTWKQAHEALISEVDRDIDDYSSMLNPPRHIIDNLAGIMAEIETCPRGKEISITAMTGRCYWMMEDDRP